MRQGKAARLRCGSEPGQRLGARIDAVGLDTLSERNQARRVGFNQKCSAFLADRSTADEC